MQRTQWLVQHDIKAGMELKALQRRLPLWMELNARGGSGLAMADVLREQWWDTARRMLRDKGQNMPATFDVAESFLALNAEFGAFGLREEREHMLCADDFFLWYRDREQLPEPDFLLTAMQEGVAYTYNMTPSGQRYLIQGDACNFVIAGVALARHEEEISCILLAGEDNPVIKDEEAQAINGTPEWKRRGYDTPGPGELRPMTARYLPGYPEFARVFLMLRFDAVLGRNNARTVASDCGPQLAFLSLGEDILKKLPSVERAEYEQRQPQVAGRYEPLDRAAASFMYLPLMFAALPQWTKETTFATSLAERKGTEQFRELRKEFGYQNLPLKRTVRIFVPPITKSESDRIQLTAPDLRTERDGCWKTLAPGEIGQDADGNAVVGKTWMQRVSAWQSTDPQTFLLQRAAIRPLGPDPGIVYIMRSLGHGADIYKVGLTRRSADERAKELSSATGVPLPFNVLASHEVGNCGAIEAEVHRRLDDRRLNDRREYFFISYGELNDVLGRVIAEIDGPGHTS